MNMDIRDLRTMIPKKGETERGGLMIALARSLESFKMATAPEEDPGRARWFPSGEKT